MNDRDTKTDSCFKQHDSIAESSCKSFLQYKNAALMRKKNVKKTHDMFSLSLGFLRYYCTCEKIVTV